jgi:hypothetical protein
MTPTFDILGSIGYDCSGVNNEDLIRELQGRVEYHRSQLVSYEKAIAALKRETNPAPTASAVERSSRHYVKGAKIEYIVGLLEKFDGLTAAQMREQARKDGVAVNAAFPYSMLKALKERGEVTEKQGKYFPLISEAGEHDVVSGTNSRTTKKGTGER